MGKVNPSSKCQSFIPLLSFFPCRLCAHRPGRVVGSALPCQHCQPVMTWWGFEPGQEAQRSIVNHHQDGKGASPSPGSAVSLGNLESDLMARASRCCREIWVRNTTPPTIHNKGDPTVNSDSTDFTLCCCKGLVSLHLNDVSDRSCEIFLVKEPASFLKRAQLYVRLGWSLDIKLRMSKKSKMFFKNLLCDCVFLAVVGCIAQPTWLVCVIIQAEDFCIWWDLNQSRHLWQQATETFSLFLFSQWDFIINATHEHELFKTQPVLKK